MPNHQSATKACACKPRGDSGGNGAGDAQRRQRRRPQCDRQDQGQGSIGADAAILHDRQGFVAIMAAAKAIGGIR